MKPLSHQLLAWMPPLLAVGMLLLFATPMQGVLPRMAPNIVWLMTIIMVAHYPAAWTASTAFFLGLLQDMLMGTPLGAQALQALLLRQLVARRSALQQVQIFRLRWLEAAGMLVASHFLLWLLMQMVQPHAPSLIHMLQAGLMNALWYPCFYAPVTRLFGALPDAK